jgi:hypothetical protein
MQLTKNSLAAVLQSHTIILEKQDITRLEAKNRVPDREQSSCQGTGETTTKKQESENPLGRHRNDTHIISGCPAMKNTISEKTRQHASLLPETYQARAGLPGGDMIGLVACW